MGKLLSNYNFLLIAGVFIFIGSLLILADIFVNPFLVPVVEKNMNDFANLPRTQITLGDNKVKISAFVLKTSEEKKFGLSRKPFLARNDGALFVYDEPQILKFWMKDMLFPIDIIWIDKNFKIVDFSENLEPESYPKTFSPKKPVKYVLEVNAGFVKKYHLKVGDKVEFNLD